MAANDKISFLLDLDVKEFTEKGLQAQGVIEKIGDKSNLAGLLSAFDKMLPILAAGTLAFEGLKKAIDITLEAEEIERINKQFDILTRNAGVAPEKLKKGLEEAAKGLVETDTLLKITNETLLKVGGSAERMPELMTIAAKATQVYGGNAKDTFQVLSQALSEGNVGMLRRYGLTVDIRKAMRDFAAQQGVTMDQLSESAKRQAIFNAALDAGNKNFKDIEVNMNSATNIIQSLKTTFSDLGQIFIIVFDKTIGPRIRTFLAGVQHIASTLKNYLSSMVEDSASAESKAVERKAENIAKSRNLELIDQEKREKQIAAFNAQIAKGEEDLFNQKVNSINTIDEVQSLSLKQRELFETQHAARINQINSSLVLDKNQKAKLIELNERTHQEQMRNLELETDAFRKKLLDKYVANSNSAFQGISRAFIANSQKMKMEQNDFGKRGTEMWNSLSSNATAAFTNMGAQMAQGKDIGEATADALKGVFLGMLGDRAIAEGSILLLSSIWPPNPLGLTAGAGLLALGGALKAVAGGAGGAPTTAAAGPSPQAAASGAAPKLQPISSAAVESQQASAESLATATPGMEGQQKQQRSVSVHIAGNYLETDQTKRMLMDLMRQESDATGFSYNQIGA